MKEWEDRPSAGTSNGEFEAQDESDGGQEAASDDDGGNRHLVGCQIALRRSLV